VGREERGVSRPCETYQPRRNISSVATAWASAQTCPGSWILTPSTPSEPPRGLRGAAEVSCPTLSRCCPRCAASGSLHSYFSHVYIHIHRCTITCAASELGAGAASPAGAPASAAAAADTHSAAASSCRSEALSIASSAAASARRTTSLASCPSKLPSPACPPSASSPPTGTSSSAAAESVR